jgi:DHA2 family multidrug resistance protein-like MFS transporter
MTDESDGLPPGKIWGAMLTVAISVAVAVMDSAIANIALPTIADSLHTTPSATIWVVSGYQMSVAVCLLPMSSLGDIYGYKRIYGIGLIVFLIASAGCAMSTSLPMLVAFRALQGIGGAGIMGVNGALVRHIFPRARLGQGLGTMSLIVATSAAIGPSVAAGILAIANWPWLFTINLPLGLIALSFNRLLPVTGGSGARFDVPGAIMNALTFGLVILALDGFGSPDGPVTSLVELAGAAAIGFVFIRRQHRVRAPVLPVDLFRRPIFAMSVLTSVFNFIAQGIAYVAVPFLLQVTDGMTVIETGVLMTPWPLAVAITAQVSGRLSDHFPAGILGGIGLTVMTIGLVSLIFLPVHPLWWEVGWRMAISGAGFAFFQAPNNRLIMSSVPRERSGAGSGVYSTARLLGQTMGAATVALVFGLTASQGIGYGVKVVLTVAAVFCAAAAVISSARMLPVIEK